MGIGGIIEILIAIFHFVWPVKLINTGEFSGLSGDYSDLVILSSLSIGLCLFIFGILSIYFSRRLLKEEKTALVYSTSQAVLWGVRGIFEAIFPVSVPIYFMENPTIYILSLSFLLSLLFLTPLLMKEGFR